MSIKFATGFEHPILFYGGSAGVTFDDLNTMFNNHLKHVRHHIGTTGTVDLPNITKYTHGLVYLHRQTYFHTKHNGYSTNGAGSALRYFIGGHTHNILVMKKEKFTDGFYVNMWWCANSRSVSSPYDVVYAFSTGTKTYGVALKSDLTTGMYLCIRNMTPGEETDYVVATEPSWTLSTPIGPSNTTLSLDNSGVVTASFNGVTVSYDISSVTGQTSFTQWDEFGVGTNPDRGNIDDIIVCDGSGTEYNTVPPSVKIPFVYTAQTYESSINTTASDGGTILDVLTDQDDSTYAITSPFPGNIRMVMPPLSGMLSPSEANDVAGVIAVTTNMYDTHTTQSGKQVAASAKVSGTTSDGETLTIPTTPEWVSLFTTRYSSAADWSIAALNNGTFHIQLDVT